MKKIKIITDSSCDLNKDIIEKYNITLVPLNVTFGNDTYIDGELENKEFYRKMASSKELPKTSCPSPEKFLKSYDGEEDIIVFTIASELSGTYSAALLAKTMYEENNEKKKIAVIDTKSGSIGHSQLMIKAAQLINENKSFEDVVETIENLKTGMEFYGSLETLENAIKGGRVNALAGKLINALNFKVIIRIKDGIVKPIDKARGDKNSISKVVEKVCSYGNDKKTLWIAHANCLDKALKTKEMMLKNQEFEDVNIVEIGPVMGTYTSEGAILISIL